MKYPENSELFKELIPFTKHIIKLLRKNKIYTVIYGSYSHFVHTNNSKMKINDIDLLIKKKDFKNAVKILKNDGIKFKYYPKWETIVIKNGKLKVEIDSVCNDYKLLTDNNLFTSTKKTSFYGISVKMITLDQLEEMYLVAYKKTTEDKAKILKKIKHLENFLGRKLK
jgi:hypothetical protein